MQAHVHHPFLGGKAHNADAGTPPSAISLAPAHKVCLRRARSHPPCLRAQECTPHPALPAACKSCTPPPPSAHMSYCVSLCGGSTSLQMASSHHKSSVLWSGQLVGVPMVRATGGAYAHTHVDGSSRYTTRGRPMKAMPTLSRRRMPPEYSPASLSPTRPCSATERRPSSTASSRALPTGCGAHAVLFKEDAQ